MKQETLEEAVSKFFDNKKHPTSVEIAEIGAKWQQENSYSEAEVKSAFKVGFSIGYGSDVHAIDEKNKTCEEWFEQFKKK